MKHIRFLFALMAISFSFNSLAQYPVGGALTVFAENGEKFYLILNGERYNNVPQTNIRIEDLIQPYYNCKIIFENKNLPVLTKKILQIADVNGALQDVTYNIKQDRKGRYVLRPFSYLPPLTAPTPMQYAQRRPATCATYSFNAPNVLISGPGFDATLRLKRDNRFDQQEHNHHNHDLRHNEYNDNHNDRIGRRCSVAMNSRDFEDAKSTISNTSFDATKLSTAKQILSSNCMSTQQIVAILDLISFESTKLELAKYAYSYCVDPNNYFRVSNSFSYSSSKTDLNNYIQNNRY